VVHSWQRPAVIQRWRSGTLLTRRAFKRLLIIKKQVCVRTYFPFVVLLRPPPGGIAIRHVCLLMCSLVCHSTDCSAVKICWPVSWRWAAAEPVPGLCCSRYTGCQSASASVTKSPLWRSRLVGCPRRRTWIHCWMTTSHHGLSDLPARRVWSFRERAQNLPSERSPSLHQLYGMEQSAGRRHWRKQFTVLQKHLKTYLYQRACLA